MEKGYPTREQAQDAANKAEIVSGRKCEVYYDSTRLIHKWTFRVTESEKTS